jgi:predicted dehydrogenase
MTGDLFRNPNVAWPRLQEMDPMIKVAVIGTGALGKEHARLYAEMHREGLIECVGVHDHDRTTAEAVAKRHRIPLLESMEEAAEKATALSVVTPTTTHFAIASQLLSLGKHLLVEKPMTDNTTEAKQLVQLAHRHDCALQIGHVERFNPVFNYLNASAKEPKFIEAHRLSPYPARSTDIGVVLDLMIHDLDVVLAFVRSPVVRVDSAGVSVLSKSEDIANARLTFENGCVANLTASRISPERLRKIRVFSGGKQASYISLDYRAQEGFIYRIASEEATPSSFWTQLLASKKKDFKVVSEFAGKKIVREPVPINKEEPLKMELRHFIECVQAKREPAVSGASAKEALDLALEITRQIQEAP